MKITTLTKLTLALAATFGLAFIAAADTAQLPPIGAVPYNVWPDTIKLRFGLYPSLLVGV